MNPRSIITHLITMGDSLSDRGTLGERHILGIFSLGKLSGLDKSPQNRFTNGLVWDDHFVSALACQFNIEELEEKKKLSASDIADGIIDKDEKIESLENRFSLKNNHSVGYNGDLDFVRNYNEGGLTAHDWRWAPSYSPSRLVARQLVSNLGAKRAELLADDTKNKTAETQKEQTLVIEWSGANDIITVNAEPSEAEVDLAIAARMQNAEELIKNGYRHFVLFNLPDLSLTPRYQQKTLDERKTATTCCNDFNEKLKKACHALQQKYPDCSIDVFDVNTQFKDMYEHPEKYGFDPAKLTQPFIQSKNFNLDKKTHTSPAEGYMFWDDIHPTADVHARLASEFALRSQEKYRFEAPTKLKTDLGVWQML